MESCRRTGGVFRTTLVLLALLLLLLPVLLGEAEAGHRAGGGGRRRRSKRTHLRCTESSLAEYQLTFHGVWSAATFPRMYPRHRPPAQWSKLVGRSHDSSYTMWRLGEKSNSALKDFSERGDSTLYDAQPQGYGGVFDTFHAEPVTCGEGWTSTGLLADGRHSRVSFVVKLVPSPDWFVGVDSLELCRHGRWRARAYINLRPVDAGTDRGYTFTSPNWPSTPHQPVHHITSSFPNHPASAFLYPRYRRLPRLAYVEVVRVGQYYRKGAESPIKSNRTQNLKVLLRDKATPPAAATPAQKGDELAADGAMKSNINLSPAADPLSTLPDAATPSAVTTDTVKRFPASAAASKSEGKNVPKPPSVLKSVTPDANVKHHPITLKNPPPTMDTTENQSRRSGLLQSGRLRTTDVNRRHALLRPSNLMDAERGKEISSRSEPASSLSEHTLDEPQFPQVVVPDASADNKPVDCLVGEWTSWSSCSKTCGFGVRLRSRAVIAYSRNAGLACPLLQQEALCGSMRTCKWKHFSFLGKRRRRAGRRRRRHYDQQRAQSVGEKSRQRLK